MDTDLIYAIIAVFILLVFTLLALCIYSGLFVDVEVRAGKPPFEGLTIAYKFAKGPYRNAGELFTELSILVPHLKSVGIYYDNPTEKESSSLRYVVGAILDDGLTPPSHESKTSSGVSDSQPVDQPGEVDPAVTAPAQDDTQLVERSILTCPYQKDLDLCESRGYKVFKFPPVDHVVYSKYPNHTVLSVMFAVSRVYPRLRDFIKERGLCAHPMMEIYDASSMHFVAPLSRQDEYYVPEATEETSYYDIHSQAEEHRAKMAADGDDSVGSTPARRKSDASHEPKTTDHESEPVKGSVAPSTKSSKSSSRSSFEELNAETNGEHGQTEVEATESAAD